MRSFTIGRFTAATLIAATAALVGATAEAGELLVIPYTCRVVGGAPELTPSADQGYAIIGQREQRDFTACSPVNPAMCRRWTLYRFDVDCAGKRVPWTSLSAAADAHIGGRSWLENGRMHLEMPPRWNVAPDDPCARRSRYAWRPGLGRDCADRRAMAPPPVVEMPAGFAPMLELDAIFVADGARVSGLDPAAARSVAEHPSPKTTRVEVPPPTRAADTPVKKAAPAAPPVAKSEPVPEPPNPVKHPVNPESTPPIAPATQTVTAAGTTIINGPNSPSVKAQPDEMASAPPETTSSLADAKDAPVKVAERDTSKELTPHAAPAAPAEESSVKSIAVTLVDGLGKSISPTLLGLGGVTMLGLLALAFAYRRDQTQPSFGLSRDLAAVSFDGRTGRGELVRSGSALTATAPSGGPPQSPVPTRIHAPANWGDAVPQTREEALQVLGMGVAPQFNETAIKKIVDGLRLSWHPDYASSPQDRELRELRMKQINAAWDIIVAKRAS
jgi:hypothetical protein